MEMIDGKSGNLNALRIWFFGVFVNDFSYCVPFTRFNIRGTTIGDRIMR